MQASIFALLPMLRAAPYPLLTADVSAQRARFLGGMAMAALSAILFSAKAIVAKLTYGFGVDAVTVVALRMSLALPAFAAVSFWYRRRHGPLARRDQLRIAALGIVGYYAATMLDFVGLQYVTAALERLILFLNPTLVVLLTALVFRRGIGRRAWLAMGVSYAGIALVFAYDLRLGGAEAWWGSFLIFGAALTYAVYLVGVGELVRRLPPLRVSAGALVVAIGACVVHFLVTRPLGLLVQPVEVYGLSAINALLCTVAPVFLLILAIERIGASAAAQTGMIGPVATIALGAWVLGEPVTIWQVGGGALVLFGAYLLARR